MSSENLQLLSIELIEEHAEKVKEIDNLCKALWRGLGWHYLLDLIWILNEIEKAELPAGSTILDAGGGQGMLQYLLAERGYNIVSVDYSPRRIPRLYGWLYDFEHMGYQGVIGQDAYSEHIAALNRIGPKLKQLPYRITRHKFAPMRMLGMLIRRFLGWRKPGRIQIYHADMMDMGELVDGSVDAVVSVSAIEHMQREDIPKAAKELVRILKPGGILALTLSAAREEDWFSENASGWCFTSTSLRDLFEISPKDLFGPKDYDLVMAGLQKSRELQKRLASSYYISGDNGMPWGIWDPKYIPVGVMIRCKEN